LGLLLSKSQPNCDRSAETVESFPRFGESNSELEQKIEVSAYCVAACHRRLAVSVASVWRWCPVTVEQKFVIAYGRTDPQQVTTAALRI
jgi:hypothetical protein